MTKGWDRHRFAIMMPWGRVGSNLVVGVLGNQRGVVVANEPTTVLRTRTAGLPNPNFQADMAQTQLLQHWPNLPIQSELLRPFMPASSGRCFGLKLSHRSIVSPMTAYTTLRDRNFHIVKMDRRNHVKAAISQIRADQRRQVSATGAFALRQGDQQPGPSKIPVRLLITRVTAFEALSAEMDQYLSNLIDKQHIFETFYEDLMEDPKSQIRRIAAFLEIPLPADFSLPFGKFTSDNLQEVIQNYGEVANGLSDAGYSRFLTN